MGKRNVRIRRHELKRRLQEIKGETVHVIMLEGTTYAGKCMEVKPDALVIRDANARWTSLRRHTHTLPLSDILEVIFDKVTDY